VAEAAAQEELPVEPVAVEAVAEEGLHAGEMPAQMPTSRVKEAEEVEAENAKDGVSLDELFKMKPEIFHAAPAEEEDADKKKGKKQKKKGVELVLDEELGEVVGRKKHKRGDDNISTDE
jgi:hypothetical protein